MTTAVPAHQASGAEPATARPTESRRRRRAAAYLALTKPRVVELLLVTTVPSMVLAARGWPSSTLLIAVLVGGGLSAGGANAINSYIDRDRDRVMRRTAHRPIPSGQVSPRAALTFGIALEALAFVGLWAAANLLAATLAVGAALFYIFVYSLWLKPRSAHNIVIGGAAGAAPVLVGWAAVRGGLAWPAVVLFAVIFLWTPAHFWALAVRYREDYAAAGIPMLPVIADDARTTKGILRYAWATVLVSLLLYPVADLGTVYVVSASLLGGYFLWHARRLRRRVAPDAAMSVFKGSNTYLALLFLAVAMDVLV
ncbi:MAG: heme o synthase [Acidimicrobiia bacterium]